MAISPERRKLFRQIGHNLKPVLIVAENGLSEGVMAELDRALEDHELIKVKFAIADRDARKLAVEALCKQAGAELVQEIGKIALVFKPTREPNPRLSNLLRQF